MQAFCPSAIDNIECEVLFRKKNNAIYCIGNVDIDNYIFVNEKQRDAILGAIGYMDGHHSLDEIQELLLSEHNIKIDVRSLVKICIDNGFIKNVETPEKPVKKGFNELDTFMVNLFSLSIDRFGKAFALLSKHLRSIIIIMIVTTIALLCLLFFHKDKLNVDITWTSLLTNATTIFFYMLISAISVILHELSHVVVAYRYGVRPKTLTVALYAYITPMFYVRLNGIYLIKPSYRIFVWAAGSMMNLFLATVCFALMNFTTGLLCLFFMTGVVCNLLLGLYSLIPLVISDGYYILATLLKTPNMRKSSFSKTLNFLKGNFNKESLIYVLYCLAFVGVLAFFLVGRIYALVNLVVEEYGNGQSFFQIISHYIKRTAYFRFTHSGWPKKNKTANRPILLLNTDTAAAYRFGYCGYGFILPYDALMKYIFKISEPLSFVLIQ